MAKKISKRAARSPTIRPTRVRSFRRVDTENKDVKQVVDNADHAVRNILPPPFKEGKLVTVVFSGAGLKDVAHGLSGRSEGAIIVDLSNNVTVFSGVTPEPQRETHRRMVSTGACTVKLWIWR